MNDIQLYDYQLQMLHDIEKILAEPSCKSKDFFVFYFLKFPL